MNRMQRTILSVCVLATCGFACAGDLPPAFSDIKLDEAMKLVDGTEKVVVIKFTAEWCGPCKAMDKTTWRDDSVVKWVKENGVAIQVDVDKDKKTAEAYNIEAMPTMVMLRGGKELTRTLGYMNPQQTLSWLESAATGKAPPPATDPNVPELLRVVGRLDANIEDKKYAEAIVDVQEIWSEKNAADSMRRVGVAQMLQPQLRALLAASPESRSTIVQIRDGAEQEVQKGVKAKNADVNDWLALNDVLSDDAKSLAWFDKLKEEPGSSELFEPALTLLTPLLARHQRVADLAAAVPNGTEWATMQHDRIARFARARKHNGEEQMRVFEVQGAKLYAGYVAAHKLKDANEFAETMLQLRDTPTMRVALVEESVNTGVTGPGAKLWLDEAAAAGSDVSAVRARMLALQKK
ncbi:MAG: thioredoxin family protein [Phycisphaerales bacterium]